MKQKRKAAVFGTAVCMIGLAAQIMTAAAADAESIACQQLAAMSREEKAGQMLLVSPSQLCEGGDWTAQPDTVVQKLNQYHIGGLILFEEDLKNTDALTALETALQGSTDPVPAVLMAGTGGSLADGFAKPAAGDASVLGLGQLASGAEAVWAYTLSEEPGDAAAASGLQQECVPGTGTQFAVVTHDKAKNALDDGRPASMSRAMVTTELKGTLQFDGIVLTDSLSMPSATENYGADMAVMYALQAGADILTAPADPAAACNGILSAIDEQLVTEEQIDASVLKLLTWKAEQQTA